MKNKEVEKKRRKRHPLRDVAGVMFITTDITAKEIAAKLKLTEKTVGDWREEDNWDEQRTLRNVSPVALIKRLNQSVQIILENAVVDGKPRALSADEADSISKLSKAAKDLRNSVDPQTIMEVLNGYTSWLSIVDADLAGAVAEKNIVYVQEKLKEVKTR